MRRILVTGGRKYSNREFVYRILNNFLAKQPFILIHGDADGLDTLAKEWAIENNVEIDLD